MINTLNYGSIKRSNDDWYVSEFIRYCRDGAIRGFFTFFMSINYQH